MYDNIGTKIKSLAKTSFIVEAIGAVITGFILMVSYDNFLAGLLTIIAGPLVAWAGSWLLYGFGELIDKVSEIAQNTNVQPFNSNYQAPANNQKYQEKNEKITGALNAKGIMDIPKRNS